MFVKMGFFHFEVYLTKAFFWYQQNINFIKICIKLLVLENIWELQSSEISRAFILSVVSYKGENENNLWVNTDVSNSLDAKYVGKNEVPVSNYMFKVIRRNTRTRCEICSKLNIKMPESHLVLVSKWINIKTS